jgi:hypothetical protein
MKRDCWLKRSRSCSFEHRPPKKMCHSVSNPGYAANLSNDILHHVIGFFVSKSGPVDGQSLRSASLVCKQWQEVVYSSSVWAGVVGAPGDQVDSVGLSLQIRETEGRKGASKESLIGFVKLDGTDFNPNLNTINFRVLERATNNKCILSIARDDHKTPEMMKEIFQAHFQQQEDFLRPLGGKETRSQCRDLHFPRGICVLNGRVVRWYEDSAKNKPKNLSKPRILTPIEERCHAVKKESSLTTSGRLLENLELNHWITHLLNLEKTFGPLNSSRPRVRMDRWATIVDWIIEIVECFNLDDNTAFHTMALFERFVSTNMVRVIPFDARLFHKFNPPDVLTSHPPLQQRVKTCHYQLVAGACLLIASKCSKRSISSSDIAFCADNSFNVDEITGAEDFILQQLEWKLAFPTPLDFVKAYAQASGLADDSQVFLMMRYVVELALQSPIYLAHKPSMLAASVVVLARFCIQDSELWPEALERETNYSLDDLRDCTMELSGLLDNIRSTMPELIMISRRYRKPSRHCVADISIPSLSSFASLTAYHESHSRRQSNRIPT